jgi:cell division protein FtsL
MSKQILNNKGVWQDVFKFLDINDYLNLELSNKNFRTQLLTFYQMKVKTIKPELQNFPNKEKNLKKVFLSTYMNSFVILRIKSEYDGYEANQKQLTLEDQISKNSSSINNGMFVANNHTSSCFENSLFNQE